ncbi:hypothetical protein ACPWSR_03585 [Alloiococcus sp. CFN-8]|uniref:hypothetical protein n=1 Tax=Alloiococcus sp. CFN-8 TaxID=3416081 RepID=UPI003CF4CC6C
MGLEREEIKVKAIFQIVQEYFYGKMSIEEAKSFIFGEMAFIRPKEFAAVKLELRIWLDKNIWDKDCLLRLFEDYLSPSYSFLEEGHPLKIYQEENNRIRDFLEKADELQEKEVALEEWKATFKLLDNFNKHYRRQQKNFYPLLIQLEMKEEIERVNELGDCIIKEMKLNLNLLCEGNTIEFLYYLRELLNRITNFLTFEERVLFSKALSKLSNLDFQELRKIDDIEGYIQGYIPLPYGDRMDKEPVREYKRNEVSREILDGRDNIKSLFYKYPKLKRSFYSIHEDLMGLKTPMGRDLLKNSTIAMVAKSLGWKEEELIRKINQLIESY